MPTGTSVILLNARSSFCRDVSADTSGKIESSLEASMRVSRWIKVEKESETEEGRTVTAPREYGVTMMGERGCASAGVSGARLGVIARSDGVRFSSEDGVRMRSEDGVRMRSEDGVRKREGSGEVSGVGSGEEGGESMVVVTESGEVGRMTPAGVGGSGVRGGDGVLRCCGRSVGVVEGVVEGLVEFGGEGVAVVSVVEEGTGVGMDWGGEEDIGRDKEEGALG
jgi:hypothetical protein